MRCDEFAVIGVVTPSKIRAVDKRRVVLQNNKIISRGIPGRV